MAELKKARARLRSGHTWQAQPDHKILVLGRGAVRLDYPEAWVVEAQDDCVKVYDHAPPDDECALGVSFHHWPVVAGRGLSVGSLVRTALEDDERSFLSLGSTVEETRIDLELAWAEGRFIDPQLDREACTRLCLARKSDIQALVTFDFWRSDLERCDSLWRSLLASLELGEWVADFRQGPSIS